MSEKSRRIMKEIANLYSFGTERKTVEEISQQNYEKLLDKEEEWDKAFEEYDVDDVLHAIDSFWRFKSDKNRPSVAQILSYLSTDKEVKKINPNKSHEVTRCYCVENVYFERDKALGRVKYNLPTYRKAVDRIMKDMMDNWLADNPHTPLEDDAKEQDWRYKKSLELGYFNELDAILDEIDREEKLF